MAALLTQKFIDRRYGIGENSKVAERKDNHRTSMTYEVTFHLTTRTSIVVRVQEETPEAVRKLITREALNGLQWLRLSGLDTSGHTKEVSIRLDQLAATEIARIASPVR